MKRKLKHLIPVIALASVLAFSGTSAIASAHCRRSLPVCHVDDCTKTGRHTHGRKSYSGHCTLEDSCNHSGYGHHSRRRHC